MVEDDEVKFKGFGRFEHLAENEELRRIFKEATKIIGKITEGEGRSGSLDLNPFLFPADWRSNNMDEKRKLYTKLLKHMSGGSGKYANYDNAEAFSKDWWPSNLDMHYSTSMKEEILDQVFESYEIFVGGKTMDSLCASCTSYVN